jgi:hypothetical protein
METAFHTIEDTKERRTQATNPAMSASALKSTICIPTTSSMNHTMRIFPVRDVSHARRRRESHSAKQ